MGHHRPNQGEIRALHASADGPTLLVSGADGSRALTGDHEGRVHLCGWDPAGYFAAGPAGSGDGVGAPS
ncbi:hypothetical protein BSA16_11460 [Micromonospora sp. Rc5]|nr:hypothetical protein BSA16_11460 [Micromonospora sp. Rc5]